MGSGDYRGSFALMLISWLGGYTVEIQKCILVWVKSTLEDFRIWDIITEKKKNRKKERKADGGERRIEEERMDKQFGNMGKGDVATSV